MCVSLSVSFAAGLDLSFLTTYAGPSGQSSVRLAQAVHSNGPVLDDEILADKEIREAIKTQGSVTKSYEIVNVDRAALGRVAGAVAKPYGDAGVCVLACFCVCAIGSRLEQTICTGVALIPIEEQRVLCACFCRGMVVACILF